MNIKEIFINIFSTSYYSVLNLLPYIIIGIVIGEILKISSWTKILIKINKFNPFITCLFSCLLGIASPLCTLGTVPVAISLYSAGFSLAPLIGFISCSSMLNPQFLLYTYGQLGLEATLGRFVTVLIFGMIICLILIKIDSKKLVISQISDSTAKENENCILNKYKEKPSFKTFIINCLKQLEFIGFYMLIGILIASAFEYLIPRQTIYQLFAPNKWYSVIFASILGVPLYQCGGGAIPIIGTLLKQGMGIGQALAFFLVGPATNINSIIAFMSIFKKKFVIIYLVLVILYALLIGYLYPYLQNFF